jgi:hypothetical protein
VTRVLVPCPECRTGHNLPENKSGEVVCQGCGVRFHADTRQRGDPDIDGFCELCEAAIPRGRARARTPSELRRLAHARYGEALKIWPDLRPAHRGNKLVHVAGYHAAPWRMCETCWTDAGAALTKLGPEKSRADTAPAHTPVSESPLKASPLLLLRNMVFAAIAGVAGFYMVQTSTLVIVIFGGGLLVVAPVMLIYPLFAGLPGRGSCPECGGAIQTMERRAKNLFCRGCDSYLDAENGVLKRTDPSRVADTATFAAPLPWEDITLVVSPTIATSADDVIRDAVLTKRGGVRVLEAHWPSGCCVCGAPATRAETLASKFTKVDGVRDTAIEVRAEGVPHCDSHDGGAKFESLESASPDASGCFALKFRSLAYRNAFMRAHPWRFYWRN